MVGAVDRQEAHGMAASIAQVAFVASLEQPLPFTQEPDAAAAATMVNGLISLCLLPTIKMENAP
jgi:hypothetical protein